SVNSGLVLDVKDKSTANGAAIQQWSYGGGKNQQWTLKSTGSGAYEIVSVGSGKCLDVKDASTANGAAVQQWACSGGDNQRWKLVDVGPQAGGGGGGGGGGTGGKIEFAPYFETWAWGDSSYSFTSLVDMKNKSGVNGATLAFVLADGGCKATRDIQD